MFGKVNVAVLGIIENMSYYINSDGSKEYIFGQGGGQKLSDELGIGFLGEIPLNKNVRIGGDEGMPIVLKMPESLEAVQFLDIARNIVSKITESNKQTAGHRIPIIEI